SASGVHSLLLHRLPHQVSHTAFIQLLPGRFIVGKPLSQFDLWAVPQRRAAHDRADTRMDFIDSSQGDHLANVVVPNSSPCHDPNPSTCLPDESRDSGCALQRSVCPARCKNSRHTSLDQLVERLRVIEREIEGAMESDRQWLCLFYESAEVVLVDRPISVERAADNALRPLRLGQRDVAQHGLYFRT